MRSSSKLLQYLLLLIFTLALAQQTPNGTDVTSSTNVTQPTATTTTTTTPPAAPTETTTATTTPQPPNNTTVTSTTAVTQPTATTTTATTKPAPPSASSSATPNKPTTTSTTTTTAAGAGATPPATTSASPSKPTTSTTVVAPVVKPAKPVHHRFNGEVQPYEVCLDGADNSFIAYNPSVGDFGTRNFTVALWIQTNDTLSLYDIVGNRNESAQGNYFQMRMAGVDNPTMPAGQILVELAQNTTGFNYANLTSNKTGLNDGNWHYLVFVRNGLNLSLYVDGTLDNSVTAPGIANITNPVQFKVGRSVEPIAGARFSPVACYAELRVYRRALIPTHIAKLFAVQGTVY